MRCAHTHLDAPLPPREDLARQQGGTDRTGDCRADVETEAIARADMDRDHWHAMALGQAQKPTAPGPVTHAAPTHARHLTCGKYNYRRPSLQRLIDAAQSLGTTAPTEYPHRQQQILDGGQCHQELIGDDSHIAPHIANHLQQGQRIESAQRMVGDDQAAAAHRNALPLQIVHAIAHVEMPQGAFDEFQSGQMRMIGNKLLGLAQSREAMQSAQQRPGDTTGNAIEQRRPAIDDTALEILHGLPPHTMRRTLLRSDNRSVTLRRRMNDHA
jgi:hypothetical protein